MPTNPFIEQHIQAETVFTGDRKVAERNVQMEYHGEPSAVHEGCPDQGTFFYKATIGCWKCTGCGDLARVYGPDDYEVF
jgi:hypothetical protein